MSIHSTVILLASYKLYKTYETKYENGLGATHTLSSSCCKWSKKKKKQQLKLYAKLTPVELHCVNSINAATIPKS